MKKRIAMMMLIAVAGWSGAQGLASRLYADRTARAVGDLVTVMIEEKSSVLQNAKNDRSKSRNDSLEMDIPSPTLNLWKAFVLPEWSLDSKKSFDAAAQKNIQDSLSASITVSITEVLPNGNLMITGDRVVNIDDDLLKYTLTGMIRAEDISQNNVVLSSRISGASITYETVGELARSSKPGLISKIIDWVVPF